MNEGQIPFQEYRVYNGLVPKDGQPLAIGLSVDLSNEGSFFVNVNQLVKDRPGFFVQTIWVENALNPSPLMIVTSIGQTLIIPGGHFAMLPLICGNPASVTFKSAKGVVIPVKFFNVPLAPVVWDARDLGEVVQGAIEGAKDDGRTEHVVEDDGTGP